MYNGEYIPLFSFIHIKIRCLLLFFMKLNYINLIYIIFIYLNFNILIKSLGSSAVERQPFKLVVQGSIPCWGARFLLFFNIKYKPTEWVSKQTNKRRLICLR